MPTLVQGSRLGPYELLSLLGVGGMGEVWRATDSRLGRSVAIKVIAENLAGNEEIRARLQREARAVSALNHPNICSLFDIGHEGEVEYLVMELVNGETLAQRLTSGPMSAAMIVTIVAQVIEAVQEAHAQGITHRDLKPSNIMITPHERVKVLDFGVATRAQSSADDSTLVHSSAGMMIGTLAYMSPEQASGLQVDHRSDIFSIGVVLYEMATGARPFDGTAAQVAAQLISGTPRAVRTLNPAIPERLERLIERCMGKTPSERYSTAEELMTELGQVNEPEPKRSTRRATTAKKAKYESIAVLPFSNASGDAQLDYLSDGIAEGVLHQLSQYSSLRVLARSTTFRYRHNPDPVAVGKELKVHAVLTGEVSIRRGTVTVSVELVDTKRGTHLWGRVLADAEARTIDEQIARDAAAALDAGSGARASRAAIDEEAHRLYLRGRYALNKWTTQSVHSAIQSFQQAIERDPSFALGFAGLADAYLMFEPFAESAAKGSIPKARAAALRALQIDDSLAEPHTSLAMAEFNEWNWEAAERGFRRAISLNPNYETAHYWYSMVLITLGRVEEALQVAERAHRIDPLSAPIAAHVGALKVMNGRAGEGIRELKRLTELEPNIPMIHQWLGYAYFADHQFDLAVEAASKGVDVSNNGNLALANLAYLYCAAGRTSDARDILNDLLRREDVRPFLIAGVYAGLGEVDNTFLWLEKNVYEEDSSSTSTYITWPPWFDNLKTHPRYLALLRHMGLA